MNFIKNKGVNRSLITLILFYSAYSISYAQLSVTNLKTEYRTNPLGLDKKNPRFSWIIEASKENTMQQAYHVMVWEANSGTDSIMWDSGLIISDQSVHIRYDGKPLQPRTNYSWKVQISDNHGNTSKWSYPAYWETGLMNHTNWEARWIKVPWEEDSLSSEPVALFRNDFNIQKEIKSARLYASARGLYEIEINGKKVGDEEFTPGWTSYNNRIQYQTFDVTSYLQQGRNAIGSWLADGWFRGYLGWGDQRNVYGTDIALIAQLEITFTDGSKSTVSTSDDWKAGLSPVLKSDIYNGEYYDARKEQQGWSQPGFKDKEWQNAQITNEGTGLLMASEGEPVKSIQSLKPIDWLITPEGDTVLDIGQNMVGWMRLTVSGKPGQVITMRHAETLDKEGNFYVTNLRAADQTNTYVLKGEGTETWEPRFTFQGFRYVHVSGWRGEFDPNAFTAVVIHSDIEPTAHFETSHALINRLQHNIVWGLKGNFLDIPTDCPQRDERLGWTGDIQVFANTANILMQTPVFLTKWLGDLTEDQNPNGAVPHVIPNALGTNAAGAAGWGDAVSVVPWSLYQKYADTLILSKQFQSVEKWISYQKSRAERLGNPYIWDGDYHFGDWLAFAAGNPSYAGAYTHTDLIATAYFARSSYLASKMAEILKKPEKEKYYNKLFEDIKKAFQNEFLTPNGRLSSDTQTAYLLALRYNLVPGDLREKVAANLVRAVKTRGHLTTGFLGTPHLNHVLSNFGHYEVAYNLLLREDYPSWLYPVKMGATTIWERWDGIKPDSTFQTPGMNSFNHYAYGAIGEWFFKEIAGIKPDSPGYKTISIHPNPGGGLQFARAFQKTLYGKVASQWKFENEDFIFSVTIPANTKAKVTLPFSAGQTVFINNEPLPRSANLSSIDTKGDNMVVSLGSGSYQFSYKKDDFPDEISDEINAISADSSKIAEDADLATLISSMEKREELMTNYPHLMNSWWLSQFMGFTLQRALEMIPDTVESSK